MSNQGLLLGPGTVSNTANQNFSGSVTISSNGGQLTTHGPLTIGGAAKLGALPMSSTITPVSPANYGLIASNFPVLFATGTGSAVTTGGKVYLAQLPLLGSTPITNLWFSIATAAATPVTAQNFAGLYTSSGALAASTADLATAIGTNTGFIKCPLSSPYTPPNGGGIYYVGLVLNAATLPVLTCYAGQVTVTTSVVSFGSSTTFGNTAATYPFSLAASSTNTTLPAAVTMTTNTATGAYAFWTGAN